MIQQFDWDRLVSVTLFAVCLCKLAFRDQPHPSLPASIRECHPLVSLPQALKLEPENAEAREGLAKTRSKIREGSGAEEDQERSSRAMADPEIQVRRLESRKQ